MVGEPQPICLHAMIYPAWDGAANVIDAVRSGGFAVNLSQAINVTASSVVTISVIFAFTMSMDWVFGAFGIWAIFSGLLQLGTAVRRYYFRCHAATVCRDRSLPRRGRPPASPCPDQASGRCPPQGLPATRPLDPMPPGMRRPGRRPVGFGSWLRKAWPLTGGPCPASPAQARPWAASMRQ